VANGSRDCEISIGRAVLDVWVVAWVSFCVFWVRGSMSIADAFGAISVFPFVGTGRNITGVVEPFVCGSEPFAIRLSLGGELVLFAAPSRKSGGRVNLLIRRA